VVGPGKFAGSENFKETTCTCPIEDQDIWDYDMHPRESPPCLCVSAAATLPLVCAVNAATCLERRV